MADSRCIAGIVGGGIMLLLEILVLLYYQIKGYREMQKCEKIAREQIDIDAKSGTEDVEENPNRSESCFSNSTTLAQLTLIEVVVIIIVLTVGLIFAIRRLCKTFNC